MSTGETTGSPRGQADPRPTRQVTFALPPRRSDDLQGDYQPVLSEEAILWRDSHASTFVACPQTQEAFQLNETASLILSLCDGSNTLKDIVSVLVSRYKVSEEVAWGDVRASIRQFCTLNILGVTF